MKRVIGMTNDPARPLATEPRAVNIGDFFYTSWGYDQTQVDFYRVESFTPSGKSVRVKPCGKRDVSTDDNPHCAMVPDGIIAGSEIVTVRLRQDGGTSTTINGHWAGKWDGKPKYQTGHGYGH